MSTQCSVCIHHEREAIDADLATGESLRAVEERFGVPRSTLSRHQQHREEASVPESSPLPPVSLCPPQDSEAHERKRESLRQAVTAAERQLAAMQEALAVHELVLARVLAVDQARGFAPLRTDTDIDRLEPYKAWMARPQQAKAQMDALLLRWREAIRGVQRASWHLSAHDQEVAQYQRERGFLNTGEGETMETQYRDLHTAIEAATAVGNARLARVYEVEIERLRQGFLVAVQQARRAAA